MKKRKTQFIKYVSLILITSIIGAMLSSCDLSFIKHFDDWIKTSNDGFTYYYNEYSDEGVYILDIPDVEELTIPEYIDGKKVVELGHLREQTGYLKRYIVVGENTKKLTIQHQFDFQYEHTVNYVDFPNLTNLIFIDFLYCNQMFSEDELLVPYYIGKENSNVPTVELKKSDREYSLEDFKAKVIIIPDYVKKIDSGVFDGLTDVIIKTSYETKPEGWEDGWNGTCEVEWGLQLN
ncbi:MAG: hypothetical protein IKA85_01830 [Clostridia bacterium]|nr:hypothetical protein [Clostridia bacterium]